MSNYLFKRMTYVQHQLIDKAHIQVGDGSASKFAGKMQYLRQVLQREPFWRPQKAPDPTGGVHDAPQTPRSAGDGIPPPHFSPHLTP